VSGERSWLLLAVLAVAGVGTSSYLTYSHYADKATVCAGIGSCAFVQSSEYSKVAGVPVALLGLLFFIGLAGLVVARLRRMPAALQWGQPAAFAMTLGGLAFVSYLTYIELFVIDAICVWCVGTAAITLAAFVVAALGSVRSMAGEEDEFA
jgi:uncharacterized membrane protein